MPKPVPIAVTLAPGVDQHGAFQWQMGIDPSPPQPPPYPVISVAHGNSATITFTVQPGQQNISFAGVPLLVPPKSDGIDAPTVNGTSMTVTDHNFKSDQVRMCSCSTARRSSIRSSRMTAAARRPLPLISRTPRSRSPPWRSSPSWSSSLRERCTENAGLERRAADRDVADRC